MFLFYCSLYSYALEWLVIGPQFSGKSTAVYYQLLQMNVPTLIFDPKNSWQYRASALGCKVIPPEFLSFCIDELRNVDFRIMLFSIMEGIAQTTGLQYGLSLLNEASDIAIAQKQRYEEATGKKARLCLKDIYLALDLCDASDVKRKQYKEAAKTALDLVIGRNNLFATRGGLSIDELLNGNYILPCQYLSATQSRFLCWHILNYIQFKSLNLPESTQLNGLIVIDDASKFISRPDTVFGSSSKTGNLMHILSILRKTGRGVIFVDQLVEPVCDDVKQLCNNWLIVGGMRGTHNQNEIASAMGLTVDQAEMLGRLRQQEAVVYCPSTIPQAIHGFIPFVPDMKKE